MQLRDGRLIYSASDLNDFLECAHLSELERHAAGGELRRPDAGAPTRELLARKGDEHEARYLEGLRARGVEIAELVVRAGAGETLANAQARTLAALESGATYVYQPTFFDGTFMGRADFLRRVERPCAARAWSYEVIDTKLARTPKAYFLVQLCAYSLHLAALQGGSVPERMHVALGSGEERSFVTRDYLAYYRRLRASFLARRGEAAAYPFRCGHCAICEWARDCDLQRRRDDHLSLVAWMRRDQIEKLERAGLATLAALARAPEAARPLGLNPEAFADLRLQASLQLAQREAISANRPHAQRYRYHLLAHREYEGLAALPRPDRGDVYFDMEGDPLYAPEGGLEYLFGAYLPLEDEYVAFWAKDGPQERGALTGFIDFVTERRARFPEMHVYHYANYEKAALGRLTMRYAVRRDELDTLLRAQLFVDLYTIVRQSLRVSQESYSIKKLEAFYGFERAAALKRGDDSIVLFEQWLDSRDEELLALIGRYNAEDCRSTYFLHRWLLERRDELAARDGIAIPWYVTKTTAEPNPQMHERHRTMVELRDAILAGQEAPADLPALRALPDEARLRWLLANAVDYHWNESKPAWWRLHYRRENVDELIEFDHDAIGGLRLRPDIPAYPQKRSMVYTFEYPEQQHHLGEDPVDPDTGERAGSVVSIDDATRLLELKCAAKTDPAALRALIPKGPQETGVLQDALAAIGRSFTRGALAAEHPAILDLVLAAAPRFTDRARGALIQPDHLDGATLAATIAALDESYLVVQGPPGSGKSTTGGLAIARLLATGKRVGVLARSHKAAQNLVAAVERAAAKRGERFTGAHKHSKEEDAYPPQPGAAFVASTGKISEALDPKNQLVSGTPWLFSHPDAVRAFDVLVVDEAGQLALADAIACARAARNVVLLGDPLQLAQVSQGSHPPGIGRSVLEHLLDTHVTIPPQRGIFLERSWRMHPTICRFISDAVYEGRLEAAPGTAVNAVDAPRLSGSGLRWLAIEHRGNRRESIEEADAIVAEIRALREGHCTVRERGTHAIGDADILIVSPYNAQRLLIEQRLRASGLAGVRVGTVDKFQGQEAPVVFYSMATSSGDDLPRDMEFLFERNRFNVAVSRAQCMSVLVCSPRLLEIRCRTPEQMALANLLCAYCEQAEAYGIEPAFTATR